VLYEYTYARGLGVGAGAIHAAEGSALRIRAHSPALRDRQVDYFLELTNAMTFLAKQGALFLGQSIRYDGQAMHPSFSGVPMEQRIEMPVAEDFQMGFSTGLALTGQLVVSVYPRFDFLLLAANQLVNHLDKLPLMSSYRPKVIIRTAVGSTEPLNPGPQHCQDHTEAFAKMLRTVHVQPLTHVESIMPAYRDALNREASTLLIEYASEYRK